MGRMDESSHGMSRYGEKEKIPRPRNAFILFRQHHHKLLIDEWTAKGVEIPHNSEISKLLGVKWKALSGEEKVHWKGLAEKEKTDHERKYPDYRYKPVRKQRKKREAVPPAPPAPPPPAPVPHHQQVRPPLPFNNYTRPHVSEQHHAPYYLPPYYMQQAYPYNYYAKAASPQVYPAPIPLHLQMQVQQGRQPHENTDPAYHAPYHQPHQHRMWNSSPQTTTTKLHPIVSSTPVVHDYQSNVNQTSPNQPDAPSSH